MARLKRWAPFAIVMMSMIAAFVAFSFEVTHPAVHYDSLAEVPSRD